MLRMLFFMAGVLVIIVNNNCRAQAWKQLSSTAMPVNGSVSFVIDSKVYLHYMNTLLEYDPVTDVWQNKTALPITIDSRQDAIAFAINGKGYLGLGTDLGGGIPAERYRNDLWQYNAQTDSWTRMADFPGKGRTGAGCFVIGNKAYVGGGYSPVDQTYRDFWEYDPANNTWVQKADLLPVELSFPTGFSVDNMGYFVCGLQNWLTYTRNVYQYDPTTDTWKIKKPLPGDTRHGAVAFVLNNRVFFGTGLKDSAFNYVPAGNTMYEYDYRNDTWEETGDFPGLKRWDATAAVVNNKAYFGTGARGMSQTGLADWWEFSLPETAPAGNYFRIYPNPANDFIFIDIPDSMQNNYVRYSLVSITGTSISSGKFQRHAKIDVHSLASGMYFLRVSMPGVQIIEKKIEVLH